MNKNKNCQKLEIIGVLRSLIKVSIEKYEKKKCKCEKSDFENDRKWKQWQIFCCEKS